VLVVTGAPGVGKSAVLARIVTTADPEAHRSPVANDAAVCASVWSVSCAVHAKGKTALEVAVEIARAASAKLPEQVDDLAPAIHEVLREHDERRFNVIIDALDEAANPDEARDILDDIVLPLVETCGNVGAQVIVGTRRRDDDGDLLNSLDDTVTVIDLDDPQYYAEEDLVAYSMACLQEADSERTANPYSDDAVARRLARQIAAMASPNFLAAGLTARAHGLRDEEPADPARLEFSSTVDTALARYVKDLTPVSRLSAANALTALAFAEAPGLPAKLWRVVVEALYSIPVSRDDLIQFAGSAAANFLVEADEQTSGHDTRPYDGPLFQLFHQALNDALLRRRSSELRGGREADELAIAEAFIRVGKARDWHDAPAYLLRSLPRHAAAAGLVDDLLADNSYRLSADLRRLLDVADQASSEQGRSGARLLRLTPQAIGASRDERAALFSVTAALEELGVDDPPGPLVGPYRARWASARLRTERMLLAGHRGEVFGVCPARLGDRMLLASASNDGMVRIWDPGTGEPRAVLRGHQGAVFGVCQIPGRAVLASAGRDETVRIWDLETGKQLAVLEGHQDRVYAVCPVTVAGRDLLASAGRDSTVRIWDPEARKQLAILEGNESWVYGVCRVAVADRDLLASAGRDSTVRIWDPEARKQLAVLKGHESWVFGVCPVTADQRELLASASDDGTVRIWDPRAGVQQAVLKGHDGRVYGVSQVTVARQPLLASAGRDGTVRIWDPQTGEQQAVLEGHEDRVYGVCPVTVAQQHLLASAGHDGTARIWDPRSNKRAVRKTHRGAILGVCAVPVKSEMLLASAGVDGTVRIWDPQTGQQRKVLQGHEDWVFAVCPVRVDGQKLLASAGMDGTVRIWDPQTGEQRKVLQGHEDWVFAVCPITVGNREILASASGDKTVRIWDPQTGEQRTQLNGSTFYGVCTIKVEDREFLATAGGDKTVRIWDPQTGEQRRELRGHTDRVHGVCPITVAGHRLLVSASNDGTVRIWDPQTGLEKAALQGHQDGSQAICALTSDDRELIASADGDRAVQIWDPRTSVCQMTIPTHHLAWAAACIAGSLVIGLDAGILVTDVNIAAHLP
jgi:WD40 repeat protein